MTTIEELEAVYKSVFLDNPKSDHRIYIHKHQADVIRETLTQALAIKKGDMVVVDMACLDYLRDPARFDIKVTGYVEAMIAAQEERG